MPWFGDAFDVGPDAGNVASFGEGVSSVGGRGLVPVGLRADSRIEEITISSTDGRSIMLLYVNGR